MAKELLLLESKSVCGLIWQTSWPTMITFAFMAAIGVSDLYLAGQLGPSAQAAVGICDQILFLTVAISTGLAVGTSATISRSVGELAGAETLARLAADELIRFDSDAGEDAGAPRSKADGDAPAATRTYALAGLLAGACFGCLSAIIGWQWARQLTQVFTASPGLTAFGAQYIHDCAPGSFASSVVMAVSAIFRGLGCPHKSIAVWAVITSANVVLSFWFFFVGAPMVPSHSLEALAIAWDIGAFMGLIVALYQLRKSIFFAKVDLFKLLEGFFEIVRIAIPAIGAETCGIIVSFATYKLIGSDQAQAAWTIYLKLEETFALMPLMSIALAVAAAVGQNLGAKQIVRARSIVWQAVIIGIAVMTVVGTILWLAAPLYAQCLSPDPMVKELVVILFKGASFLLPLLALRAVLFAALEGAAQTVLPTCINIAGSLGFLALVCFSSEHGQSMSTIWLSIASIRAALALAAVLAFTAKFAQSARRHSLALITG